MSEPRLTRVAFKTSRLLDFAGKRELVAQVGHEAQDRFLQMAWSFGRFNPHLGLTLVWDGERQVELFPSNPLTHYPAFPWSG